MKQTKNRENARLEEILTCGTCSLRILLTIKKAKLEKNSEQK